METDTPVQNVTEPSRKFLDAQRLPVKPYVVWAAMVLCLWLAAAWLLADRRVEADALRAYTHVQKEASATSLEMAEGLARNLTVYHGVPATVGRNPAIKAMLSVFNREVTASSLDKATRQRLWTEDPVHASVSRTLAESVQDVPSFSVLWVMNAAGDCIAASNAGTKDSFVGSNYADRDYFRQAMAGGLGQQFAVGKVTGIPGLFFSAPVWLNDHTVGVVAAKIDLTYLSSWVNQADAFITDPYGVVILAKDKRMELHALPQNSLSKLSATERSGRYRLSEIPPLLLSPWRDDRWQTDYASAGLQRLGQNPMPMLHASRSIPGEDLQVNVLLPVPELANRTDQLWGDFAVRSLTGLVTIPLVFALAFFLRNWQRIKDYRERQAQIEYLSSHDPLTGLFSRAVIHQLIFHGMAVAERNHKQLAVVFIDLDRFKDVNDSLGHEAGDQILCDMATRLKHEVRASDPVTRLGGDEFVVLFGDLNSADEAARLADKINATMTSPFAVSGTLINLSASIGIAMYPGNGDDPSTLLRNADSALYRAKDGGRNSFCFYLPSMNDDILTRLAIESELREGIPAGQLVLHYQPQYSLQRQCIIGCEALVRWQHPVRGLLAPDAFIRIAEKAGLIHALSDWVLHEACRQMQTWRRAGQVSFPVAVNLSASEFRRPGLPAKIQSALDASGLPAQMLEIELTEGTLMENSIHTNQTLRDLKSLGVGISIDDFGTGYSSLAYLKRFAADVLKIDRSFILDMESDVNDRAIIQAIIQLAGSLDYRVIAEGVETERQAQLLQQAGCAEIQGYWYARPLSAAAFLEFIRAEQQRTAVR